MRIAARAVVLLVFALSVRLTALALRPFDGLYGQDAFAYYDYALALRGSLMHWQPLPAFFWPIGFPLHIVAVMGVIGPSPLAAQLVNVIAGASVAPLTYALTREVLIGRDAQRAQRAAFIAGLSVAVSGQLMISSLSIMSDATALAWVTASAWLTLRYTRTLKWPVFLLAVLALSIAVITRWIMAWLAMPLTIAVLLAWRRQWPAIGWRRGAALIVAAAFIGSMIVGGQLVSGSHTGDLQVVGWDPLNAARRDVVNTDGTFHYDWPMGVYYAQPLIHPAYIFPLFLPLLLIGGWSLRKMNGSIRAVLIGWPLLIYVFLAGIAWQNPRFMVTLLPPLAGWVAVGLDRVWPRDRRWQFIGMIYLSVNLIGASAWGVRVVDNFVDRKDADLAIVRQVDRLVPPDATLITFGLTATAQHYTALNVIELFTQDAASLDQITRAATTYLLIDVISIETQWPGKTPHVNYLWLKTQAQVRLVASLPPYGLFRVERPQ